MTHDSLVNESHSRTPTGRVIFFEILKATSKTKQSSVLVFEWIGLSQKTFSYLENLKLIILRNTQMAREPFRVRLDNLTNSKISLKLSLS